MFFDMMDDTNNRFRSKRPLADARGSVHDRRISTAPDFQAVPTFSVMA